MAFLGLMLNRENPENARLSPEEMQRELEMHMQWFNTLVERGQFKDGNPLDFEGATIRGKDKIVTDGPFVESKECVSGYYFLLAAKAHLYRQLRQYSEAAEYYTKAALSAVLKQDMQWLEKKAIDLGRIIRLQF